MNCWGDPPVVAHIGDLPLAGAYLCPRRRVPLAPTKVLIEQWIKEYNVPEAGETMENSECHVPTKKSA